MCTSDNTVCWTYGFIGSLTHVEGNVHFKPVWPYLKLNIDMPYNLEIPLPSICTREILAHVQQETQQCSQQHCLQEQKCGNNPNGHQ